MSKYPERVCQACGKKYKGVGKKFCSHKCANQNPWNRGKQYTAPERRGGTVKKCLKCGKEFYAYPYNADKRLYCSMVCANKANAGALSKARMGKGNPRYGKEPWNKGKHVTSNSGGRRTYYKQGDLGKVEYVCHICKKRLDPKNNSRNIITRCNGIILCRGCHSKQVGFKQNNKLGQKFKNSEEHWNWHGGRTFKGLSRFEWIGLARKVRKRDNHTCQNCGKSGKEVHHKVPYRISKDNSMDNLVTLCKSCHGKIEASLKKGGGVDHGTS